MFVYGFINYAIIHSSHSRDEQDDDLRIMNWNVNCRDSNGNIWGTILTEEILTIIGN
jgi:hypothetical protein